VTHLQQKIHQLESEGGKCATEVLSLKRTLAAREEFIGELQDERARLEAENYSLLEDVKKMQRGVSGTNPFPMDNKSVVGSFARQVQLPPLEEKKNAIFLTPFYFHSTPLYIPLAERRGGEGR
jgi:hypothetical protein